MFVILLNTGQLLRFQLPKSCQQHDGQSGMPTNHGEGFESSRFGQESGEDGMSVVEEETDGGAFGDFGNSNFGCERRYVVGLSCDVEFRWR